MTDKTRKPVAPKTNFAELGEIAALRRKAAVAAGDAGRAIDSPWCVAYYLVATAVIQFKRLSGRMPNKIYIPKAVEASLQVYHARELEEHGSIRAGSDYLGIEPVWDADEFKIE